MKAKSILIVCFLIFLSNYICFGQSAIVSSGADAEGNGTLSTSIGQIATIPTESLDFNMSPGVQQAFEISVTTGLVPEFASGISLTVYPNPTKDFIYVKTLLIDRFTFRLSDVKGVMIQRGEFESERMIDITPLLPGTYFLQISSGTIQAKSYTIIKPN